MENIKKITEADCIKNKCNMLHININLNENNFYKNIRLSEAFLNYNKVKRSISILIGHFFFSKLNIFQYIMHYSSIIYLNPSPKKHYIQNFGESLRYRTKTKFEYLCFKFDNPTEYVSTFIDGWH